MVMGVLDKLDRLDNVEPELVALVLRACAELGGRWRVVRGATTDAEQTALWAIGRTVVGQDPTPERPMGRTVTQARNASQTAHGVRVNGACAVDLVALNDDGTPDWTEHRYRALGAYVKKRGWEWGGDFTVKVRKAGVVVTMPFFDGGHIQKPGWRSIPLRRRPLVAGAPKGPTSNKTS